ncbi:MAG: HTH domain-containing protein [Bacteroidota bacterium]
MSDQPKQERILRIFSLLSGNRLYSIEELADRLEISSRTIYRYIETIKNAGYIIENKNNKFCIDKSDSNGKQLSDLLHFSEEEAHILSKAIHSIDENNIIKSNLIQKLYSIYDFKRVSEAIVKKKYSENVHVIFDAIKYKKQVTFINYHSAHGKSIADRLLEPFDFTSNYISVWCFDPADKKNKLFKTARIDKAILSDKKWCFEDLHQSGKMDVFRISSFKEIEVKLELSLIAYNLLIEEYPLAENDITKVNDNLYIFKTGVCSFDGVSRYVLGLIDQIKIIYPRELKNFIDKKINNSSFAEAKLL